MNVKLGNWKRMSGSVYDCDNGARIHTLGMVKLKDGSFHDEDSPENRNKLDFLIKINGGNRKRGIMAWSNELSRINN